MQARILLAIAALALPATPVLADSRDEAPRHIVLGAPTEAPRGYAEMCAFNAQWCASAPQTVSRALGGGSAFPVILSFNFGIPVEVLERASRAAALQAEGGQSARAQPIAERVDRAALDLLKRINRRVNGAVVQRRDAQNYGQGELWRRSGAARGASGDCEDIAIEKRLQLIAHGFPAEQLAYAVVYRRDVGLHTVLVARTAARDLVLDSLSPGVSAWSDAGYSWVSVQSMEDPARWHAPARRTAD